MLPIVLSVLVQARHRMNLCGHTVVFESPLNADEADEERLSYT